MKKSKLSGMKRKLASVSPWILAAACTLLAVIIGVFAVNNYSREKKLMTDALVQKGLAVIRYLDTGVVVSMRGNWQTPGGGLYSWTDHVQNVIDQIPDQPDIHFIELINSDGIVLAGTNFERIGKKIDAESINFLKQTDGNEPVFRIHTEQDNTRQVFQVTRVYKPRARGTNARSHQHGRMMGMMSRERPGFEYMQTEIDKMRGENLALLVELDLDQFNSAVQRKLLEIVILSIILLLVGIGGWLSLLTLQGLRGSQTSLQRISAFNDSIVESLPVGLIATDSAGYIKMVNASAENIAGISAGQMVAKKPANVLPEELAQLFDMSEHSGAVPGNREVVLRTDENVRRSLLLTILSVADAENNSIGDVLLIQDISEIRQLETDLRRNERLAALGKMAAGVAHELRNPLSSIKGLAVLLKNKTSGDVEGQQTADVLVQEVERLNRSITELLDYTRPERLELKDVNLGKILHQAATLVGVDAEALNITMTTSLDDEVLVKVDEDKMKQVFLNLLLNSIQAMPNGGTLSISTERINKQIACTITDSGVGISEKDLPRVFDPYFTTKRDGTGLGLALSAKIVEEHGGTVSVDSTEGGGTRVKVVLPVA